MLIGARLSPDDIERLGWDLKSEGLCRGDRCVSLSADAVAGDGSVAVQVVGSRLGMPVLHDEESGVWAIGPEAGQPALESVQLPDITLHDFDGNPFNLGQLQGRKSLLVAWASW
jgi:hypothetical protein